MESYGSVKVVIVDGVRIRFGKDRNDVIVFSKRFDEDGGFILEIWYACGCAYVCVCVEGEEG